MCATRNRQVLDPAVQTILNTPKLEIEGEDWAKNWESGDNLQHETLSTCEI